MKYDKNLKIELSWERWTRDIRSYYWRICPKQLSWWNRLFHNPWHQLQKACDDDWNPCFSPEDYANYITKLKTVGDIMRFKESEWNKIQIEREQYIKYKIKFPDEYE